MLYVYLGNIDLVNKIYLYSSASFLIGGETTGLILGLRPANKNIERHTAHTIVSWPNPKQGIMVHTSDLIMIRQSIYILSVITREMGKLKTHSPTYYYIMDDWENMLNLTHTLDKIYLTGIL